MKVRPGQSRSWQASSESCHSPGDWWVRSVDSEEAGRADTAPKCSIVAEAEFVSLTEGSIRATDKARAPGTAGVPSPGHAFTGILQELGRPSRLLLQDTGVVHPTATDRALAGTDAPAEGVKQHPAEEVLSSRGRPETAREGRGGVLRTHSTDEGGEFWQNRKTHWREGGNKRTYRLKET